jgi:hypothetical protein
VSGLPLLRWPLPSPSSDTTITTIYLAKEIHLPSSLSEFSEPGIPSLTLLNGRTLAGVSR